VSEAEIRKPEPPRKFAPGIPVPQDEVPTVPPQNRIAAKPIFKKGAPTDVFGEKEPGFEYQWVERLDPSHPQHVDNYLNPRNIGDQEVGYATMEPWEICSSKREHFTGNRREDSGKPIDTTITNGSLILIRTTAENYAVAKEYDLLRQQATAKRLGHRAEDNKTVRDDQSGGYATFSTKSLETGKGR
jgi:hypothetical protein